MTRLGYSIKDINTLSPDLVKKVARACLGALNHLHSTRPKVCMLFVLQQAPVGWEFNKQHEQAARCDQSLGTPGHAIALLFALGTRLRMMVYEVVT